MKCVEFEGQTTLLGPPPGTKRGACGALPVHIAEWGICSYWKPSPEDLALLNNGAHVRLTVHSRIHPPVSLQVERCEELP